ncbi:MAG TPA: hypothetical protein VN616_09075 [Puia sp.]|nr:hypothetical protein [Puia sp.]
MDRQPVQIRYVDPFTILVVNDKGQLRELHTPFRVQCLHSSGKVPQNAWVFVDGVWDEGRGRLFYLVGGTLHPHLHFRLQIHF